MRKSNQLFLCFFVFLSGCLCQSVDAGVVIDVGDHVLLPNTAGQQVDIFISSDPGDPLVSGMDLHAELGDGTGALPEPVFNGVEGTLDALTLVGTIFDGAGETASGQAPVSTAPSAIDAGVTTSSSVLANGILVSLFIDTTGFSIPGASFALNLKSHNTPFPTDTQVLGPIGSATPIAVTINNGQVRFAAVPEPASASLLLLAVNLFMQRRRRS